MVIEELPGLRMAPVETIHRSKITIPPVSGIPRPHLVARIDEGVRGKLTVVSAPAGWGKSTLLAEWAAQTDLAVAWVSLDEGDNNPTRYFRALAAALDHIHPMQLDDVLTMLRSPSPAVNTQIDAALLARMEEFPGETVVVLDDFHALTNPDQLRSFSRVLDQLPPSVHLIVATRGDVQLPLARLRSTGAATVLRAEDIAFTAPEAGAVLAQVTGQIPDAEELDRLVRRTEGWIAGLRLAALALGRNAGPNRAIDRIRGTQRDIADYFREEVLAPLDDDMRRFVVETAVLDRLSESLANAVTARRDARVMLDRIAAADLFLVPLDDERAWFRYHALFRDVLLAEFARLPEARCADVHGAASTWFERNGMITEAVTHAFAAGDAARAASLIDRYGDTLMFSCGEASQLAEWIEQFPDDILAGLPGLLRVYAWALTTIGQIDRADQVMTRLCAAPFKQADDPNGPDAAERDGLVAAVHARIAAYRGDDRATIVHGSRALDLLDPGRNGPVIADVVLSLGFAERALGDTDLAAERFAEAARLGRLHGNGQAARWGVRYLALTRVTQGRLRDAEAIIDEDLDRVRRDHADPGSTLSALLVAKAEVLFHRNLLPEAHAALDQAIPLIQHGGDAKMLRNAYSTLGMVLQAEGNPDAAREKLRRAESVFPGSYRGAQGAWLATLQGSAVEAMRWARYSGFTVDDEADASRGEVEQLVFARIMARIEPSPATLGLIERLVAEAEAAGRYGMAIELLVAGAINARQVGLDARACALLGRALTLAQPEGFVRVFLDEGPELRSLLRVALRDRELGGEATRAFAVEVLGSGVADPAEAPATAGLDEPLTARQLEILRLLAAGQSNREIADRLYIAEGTVKAHVHQIFGKLVARNRNEAVANARELRLLA